MSNTGVFASLHGVVFAPHLGGAKKKISLRELIRPTFILHPPTFQILEISLISTSLAYSQPNPELTCVGSIHESGWVGSVWVGLGHKILRLGWVGLGRVHCQKYLINVQCTRKKPIIRRLIIRSGNIAITVLLFIPTLRMCRFGKRRWTVK